MLCVKLTENIIKIYKEKYLRIQKKGEEYIHKMYLINFYLLVHINPMAHKDDGFMPIFNLIL